MRALALLVIITSGCATHRGTEWNTHNAGPFTFSLPAGMHKTSAHGVDSYVSEFEGESMIVSFDYGFYSNDFSGWPASTEFETVSIDGLQAKIGVVHEGFHHRFDHSAQIYFSHTARPQGGYSLSMFASCRTPEDFALAKKVFHSIRFTRHRQ